MLDNLKKNLEHSLEYPLLLNHTANECPMKVRVRQIRTHIFIFTSLIKFLIILTILPALKLKYLVIKKVHITENPRALVIFPLSN